MTNEEVVSLLNELIDANLDSAEGYQTAADAIDNVDYQLIFREHAQQRTEFVRELSELVRSYGGDPDQTGTMAGTFQRVWINIKAALTGSDAAIMEECDRSEETMLVLYGDIIPQSVPEDVKALARTHLSYIRIAHERVHALSVLID